MNSLSKAWATRHVDTRERGGGDERDKGDDRLAHDGRVEKT